jgi:hypothetical protein
MQTQSLGESFYFLTFNNDHSWFTMIYIFCYKLEVFQKFQTYKSLVENQIGQKIKTFRFDNGGKYTSNDFKRFCETHKIL